MELDRTEIAGVLILRPRVFKDDRGFFLESWNQRAFDEAVGPTAFVQDNSSRSHKNVLRGIHYQMPSPQGKLIRVSYGSIWDVAVDLRRSSPTFMRWVAVTLDAEEHEQLWIPPGCGHGFVALSDYADVHYKTTSFYDASADRAIKYDDPELAIDWPVSSPIVSAKDASAPGIGDAVVFE